MGANDSACVAARWSLELALLHQSFGTSRRSHRQDGLFTAVSPNKAGHRETAVLAVDLWLGDSHQQMHKLALVMSHAGTDHTLSAHGASRLASPSTNVIIDSVLAGLTSRKPAWLQVQAQLAPMNELSPQ